MVGTARVDDSGDFVLEIRLLEAEVEREGVWVDNEAPVLTDTIASLDDGRIVADACGPVGSEDVVTLDREEDDEVPKDAIVLVENPPSFASEDEELEVEASAVEDAVPSLGLGVNAELCPAYTVFVASKLIEEADRLVEEVLCSVDTAILVGS